MSRQIPHPQTIFHLVPKSDRAKAALLHPDNEAFVSATPAAGGFQAGLEIGYHVPARPRPEVIVEVGRSADLILPSSSISAVHFSFEVHPESKKIMFHDRSRHYSTKITPFEFRRDGTFRQIVLQPGVMYEIGAGGERKDLYEFELHWVKKRNVLQEVEQEYRHAEERAQNPRWARTVEEGPTELSSWYNTRLHTPADGGVQRASEGEILGKGACGEVSRGVDLDSGRFIAIKKLFLPSMGTSGAESLLGREVKALSSLSHENIVEYLGSNGWGTGTLYIYTSLKVGNINGLFEKHPALSTDESTLSALLKQMLQALDYLASRNILHRDVKPDNILYTPLAAGAYRFQLADFGFANQHHLAKTRCGSPLFMAPEMYFHKGSQTAKMDVWSLFVTLICMTRTAGFNEDIDSYDHALDLIRTAATKLPNLSPMAREDPTMRASAAQMLLKHFHGNGMTTPRDRVLPIPILDDPSSGQQARKAPAIYQNVAIPRKNDAKNTKLRPSGIEKRRARTGRIRIPGAFP